MILYRHGFQIRLHFIARIVFKAKIMKYDNVLFQLCQVGCVSSINVMNYSDVTH